VQVFLEMCPTRPSAAMRWQHSTLHVNTGVSGVLLVGLGKIEVLDLCFVNFPSSNVEH